MPSVFEMIAQREYRVADAPASGMTQEQKILLLIFIILRRLYRDGTCSPDDLENEAIAAGMKGRTSLQIGKGLGGKDGLRLLRARDKSVLCCKDNATNMIKRLGTARFAEWLVKEGITEEEFGAWFQGLPDVE